MYTVSVINLYAQQVVIVDGAYTLRKLLGLRCLVTGLVKVETSTSSSSCSLWLPVSPSFSPSSSLLLASTPFLFCRLPGVVLLDLNDWQTACFSSSFSRRRLDLLGVDILNILFFLLKHTWCAFPRARPENDAGYLCACATLVSKLTKIILGEISNSHVACKHQELKQYL